MEECSQSEEPSERKPSGDSESSNTNLPSEIIPKELLDSLPPEIRNILIRAGSFSGPLPPPEMIEVYERIYPGATDRIIGLTENQQEHRHQWESDELKARNDAVIRGQWFGFVLSIASLAASVFLGYMGMLLVPGLLGTIGGLGLIGNIVKYFRSERD